MDQERVLDHYRHTGALQEGHFRLSSGLHSDRYFQSARVLAHPDIAGELGAALADQCRRFGPDVVIGPAMGAIIIAHEVARALKRPAFFAERVNDRFTLRRGFAIEKGQTVLLVEDVLTTGGSILELEGVVTELGGAVVGMACVVDRRDADVLVGGRHALARLARVAVCTWKPEDCPLCAKGCPIDVPGSRVAPRKSPSA
jgi:orotate phosphoribosyltransferase